MEPDWNRMPVNLSIKNAPDEIVERLRSRALRHHRSLQGELLAILQEAVQPASELTPEEVLAQVRLLRLETPAEAVAIVRADRDGR
jgi:antitoxin FitA